MTRKVILEHLSSFFYCSSGYIPWYVTLPGYTQSTKFYQLSIFPLFQPYTDSSSHVAVFLPFTLSIPPRFNLVVYWVKPITILKAPNPTSQPIHLEEQKLSSPESTYSIQITGSHTRRNTGKAPTNDSGTSVPTPAVSCAPTPTSTPTFVPGSPGRYTNEDLQRATKLALKSFVKGQEYGQLQTSFTPCKQPLKTRFPNLYYGNSHLDCYCFCQQCKDYFKTAGANRPNWVSFATSFLCEVMVRQ